MELVQLIRLADVFLIGPMTAWAGLKLGRKHPVAAPLLIVFGVATVVYNGANFVRARSEGLVPGGLYNSKRAYSFDVEQLRIGTQVELEHTYDPAIAQEIAMDHLVEDPRYYDKLRAAGL